MKRVYADYLTDIIENCDKALRFLENTDFETFVADVLRSYAVVRAPEIIGELRVISQMNYENNIQRLPGSRQPGCVTR